MSSQKMMPLGFRFKPRIKTLISDYLMNKVKSQPLPCTDIIIEDQDLYSDAPWNILKDKDPVEIEYPGENIVRVFYVFTPVKRIGERYSRTVGDYGTWKGETGEKKVWVECYNRDGRKEKIHIGFKRLLKFMATDKDGDVSRKTYGEWIMHEYSLGGVNLRELEGYTLAQELVICKVKQTIRILQANKRKLTSVSHLTEETTKKTSDRVSPVVSNAISITSLNNVTCDCVRQVTGCVGQVNTNLIINFNDWTNECVTNQSQWPHVSTSYNNMSYNNRADGERVVQVINNMNPDFNNRGSYMPPGPPNGSHKPRLHPAAYPMPRVPLQPYHGGPPQPYAIPTRGAVHGPIGGVPHVPNMTQGPGQTYRDGFSIGGMSQDFLSDDFKSQGSHVAYNVAEFSTQASQGGYAVDYVTQGAQGGFPGSYLNQNSQAGYSRFGSGNEFMSQDYMAHGSQGLFTQVGFNDPSQEDASQGYFGVPPNNLLQTHGLMNPLYSQPFAHYNSQPLNMQPTKPQQQQ